MAERSYSGFWGLEAGSALLELADFLSWDKHDWADFERYLDRLEKSTKSKRKRTPRKTLRERLHVLRSRGVIETKKIGDRVLIRLSDDAWLRARIAAIRRITDPNPYGVCLVIYDIPEQRRHERNAFRSFLKRTGFTQMQKSVWMHKKDVAQAVATVVAELKIQPWVTVAVGKLLEP